MFEFLHNARGSYAVLEEKLESNVAYKTSKTHFMRFRWPYIIGLLVFSFILTWWSGTPSTTQAADVAKDYLLQTTPEPGSSVQTTSGLVHGHSAPNASLVSEYLGIPYAQPPLGQLRFAPPVAYTSTGELNASDYPHSCPCNTQAVPTFLKPSVYAILTSLAQTFDEPAEDCLYLNIWSKPEAKKPLKPVLLYIYGGGFQTGGTNSSASTGKYWVDEQDVVFVNFNYRVNIFGFPGASGLTQNVGLLDQRMAIEWVQENIEAFGGDPSRITIVGHSAGAASVDYHTYAYSSLDTTSIPPIAGTILMSGTASSFGSKSASFASSSWNSVAEALGCGTTDNTAADQLIECMRGDRITMSAILAAEKSSGLEDILGKFGPTVDGIMVFSNYTDLALDHAFTPVPMLIGSNSNEAGLFKLLAFAAGLSFSSEDWQNFNLDEFTCPGSTAAKMRVQADVPVYRYRYFGNWENVDLPFVDGKAWHGAEMLPLFGTSEDVTGEAATADEVAWGKYMRGAWTAFATDPEKGLEGYGWPRYGVGNESLALLAKKTPGIEVENNEIVVRPVFDSSEVWDQGCPALFTASTRTFDRLSEVILDKAQKEAEKAADKVVEEAGGLDGHGEVEEQLGGDDEEKEVLGGTDEEKEVVEEIAEQAAVEAANGAEEEAVGKVEDIVGVGGF